MHCDVAEERIQNVLRDVLKRERDSQVKSSQRRLKQSLKKASQRMQRVISKLLSKAMAQILSNADFVGTIGIGNGVWEKLGEKGREAVVQWLSRGQLIAQQLVEAGVCAECVDAVSTVKAEAERDCKRKKAVNTRRKKLE